MKPSISCELWSINRILRWTGVRLYVAVATDTHDDTPTRIGLIWYGWSWLFSKE